MGVLNRLRSRAAPSVIFPDLTPRSQSAGSVASSDPDAEAHRAVEHAECQAQALMESARQKASVLLQEGLREGRLQGRAEALAEARQRLHELSQGLTAACARLQALDAEFRTRAGEVVVDLALLIAERILHAEVRREPTLLVQTVRTALAALPGPAEIVIRANPESVALLQAHRMELEDTVEGAAMRIVGDPTILEGECVVEAPHALVDATFSAQLAEAKRRLQGGTW